MFLQLWCGPAKKENRTIANDNRRSSWYTDRIESEEREILKPKSENFTCEIQYTDRFVHTWIEEHLASDVSYFVVGRGPL